MFENVSSSGIELYILSRIVTISQSSTFSIKTEQQALLRKSLI